MPQPSEVYDAQEQQEKRPPATAAVVRAPQRDVLNHANLGLLPVEKRPLGSFGVSIGVNVAIAALILILTLNKVHEAEVHRQETLVYVTPPPKPYVPPVPKVRMPPIPPTMRVEPKITPPIPKPVVEPPKVEPMHVAAKAPAMPAPAPRPVVTPPKPVLGTFQSHQAPAAQTPRVAAAQAAGFGAPTGAHANDASHSTAVPVVGAFGSAANANQGAAARQGQVSQTGFGSGSPSGSPNGSSRGVVANTGFGSGSRPAGMPGGHGTVASTGFGAGSSPGGNGTGGHGTIASTGFGQGPPAATSGTPRVQAPVTTPIVVLAKPLPQYTAEAREAHIQGDVTLEVRFTAEGQVEVLRVISGLGHGLDEQARLAAARIRFKPATRDGKPVDQVSVIHVAFQLA